MADRACARWQAAIDDTVAAVLHEPLSWSAFLRALPSIDPIVALATAEKLGLGNRLDLTTSEIVSAAAMSVDDGGAPIPIPHPLDYDWRFSAQTTSGLAARALAVTEPGDTIAYLGAPTVHRLARRSAGRRHVLFDRNAQRIAALDGASEGMRVDLLRDELPQLSAAAVVCDPPWYPEHHEAFLWCAAQLLRDGGIILASFPPPLTRPAAADETARVLKNAVRYGLIVADMEELALTYETPPFEAAAHAAALPALPAAWRRGDLVTLRKTGHVRVPRPEAPSDDEWQMVTVKSVPLAVRSAAPRSAVGSGLLTPAVEGATLRTVSRRDPIRASVALWSSRNRIYCSERPDLLADVVERLAAGADLRDVARAGVGALEQEKLAAAGKTVLDLVDLERHEHGIA